jgi:prephenate dehydrogenase
MTSSEANFAPTHRTEASRTQPLGRIAIVGVGLMGGSIGLAVKQANAGHVTGIGRSPEKLELAQRLGAIDDWQTDLSAGIADADLIILCTTIGAIVDQIPHVLKAAPPHAVVTDIGSTKAAIVAAAGRDPRFAGGHPMCGSERTGVEASTPTLYQGATWAITPSPDTTDSAMQALLALIGVAGAVPLVLEPETHDAMVAITSHVPHVLASALMRAAGDARAALPSLARMSAGSFADMTRVAASPPEIWRDVCLTNRNAVLKTLAQYRRELDVLESALRAGDPAAVEQFFQDGQKKKAEWQAKSE